MRPSRSSASFVLIVLGGLALAACSAAPHPSSGSSTSKLLTASAAPSPSGPSSAEPSFGGSVDPGSGVGSASAEPSGEPAPSAEPTPIPSDVAACGVGEIGFATHRDEIPASLRFGGATIELTTAGLGLRNGTYDVDDAIPGGVGLTRDEIAVRVDPGTHILLRGRGLVLTGTTAASVPWASVTFAGGLATWAGPMRTLPWRLRDDGAISVSAPAEPGDWMVDLTSTWRSACLHGDGTAYGRIKVNG